jgi:hypothetical protein
MLKNASKSLTITLLKDGGQRLSLHGEWRMPLLTILQRAIPQLRFGPATDSNLRAGSLIVDLTKATYLDSTIFGMLASIAQRYSATADCPPQIYLCDGWVFKTVKMLSFDQLFEMVLLQPDEPESIEPCLSSGVQDHALFHWSSNESNIESNMVQQGATPVSEDWEASGIHPGRAVLAAHEVLSDLSEENRKNFCPLVDALAHELAESSGCNGDS